MLARAVLFLGLAWTCSLQGCDSHIPECTRYSNLDQACIGLSDLERYLMRFSPQAMLAPSKMSKAAQMLAPTTRVHSDNGGLDCV